MVNRRRVVLAWLAFGVLVAGISPAAADERPDHPRFSPVHAALETLVATFSNGTLIWCLDADDARIGRIEVAPGPGRSGTTAVERSRVCEAMYGTPSAQMGFSWEPVSLGPQRSTIDELLRESVRRNAVIGSWTATPDMGRQGEEKPWFVFERDAFNGYDGCNWVSGRWTLDSSTGLIRLRHVFTTLRGCLPERPVVRVTTMQLHGDRIQIRLIGGAGRRYITRVDPKVRSMG